MNRTATVLRSLALGLLVLAGVACSSVAEPSADEPLYFSLEVRQGGTVVARPKLLGRNGHTVWAERRSPGQNVPDYQLRLVPSSLGEGFEVEVELALARVQARGRVALLHGQQKRVELGERAGDLELSVMVMRVNSPELRTLMQLDAAEAPVPAAI